MDDDLDLRQFSGYCRLFPLTGVVLFPHAVLHLHIFEPRYRQMTEDALAGDQLVTIVRLREPTSGEVNALGSPPIETVGCLGQIIQHERLDDGRFNFLLLGRKRVRLTRELPAGEKLYRVAEVELIEDEAGGEPEGPRLDELTRLFRQVFETQGQTDPDLASLLDTVPPLGVLTDIVAHALRLPAVFKQHLLAEPRVRARADTLLGILRVLAEREARTSRRPGPFPPPFSAN
jgi:Lon protease-like protein